ncbi:MAG: SMC-Scp complex subunit ScpB, partial [Hyphomicrobiales bacterium]|nr:SMC-Scp complex subunit ScpB [Hyphomicrobiales bacterium]
MGTVSQLFESATPLRFAPDDLRAAEALVFAAGEPLDEATIAARLSPGVDVKGLMAELQRHYATRGVNLVRVAGR